MVEDIARGFGSSNPKFCTVDHDTRLVYFVADDSVHGTELWVSDGTPNHPSLAETIRAYGATETGSVDILVPTAPEQKWCPI